MLFSDASFKAAFLVAAAVVHGTAFFRRQFRWSDAESRNGWPLYGWFTGVSCLGSVSGAAACVVWMRYCEFLYRSRILESIQSPTLAELQLNSEIRVQRYRFVAAFQILFAVEFTCVTVSELFVLHRMQQFSIMSASVAVRQRAWELSGRFFLAAVVVCNVVGVLSNTVASVIFIRAAAFDNEAAVSFSANDTATGSAYGKQSAGSVSAALRTAAIQGILELFVLTMTIVCFVIVGLRSHRIIGSALRTLFTAQKRLDSAVALVHRDRQLLVDATIQGKTLHRKVVGTTVFVFFSILLRSAFRVFYAFATFFQNSGNGCAVSECDPCKNVYSHILYWLLYTPMLQQAVLLIASPVAMLVAFWGMTGARMLQPLRAGELDAARKKAHRELAGPSADA
jgi:hypothetical protein